MTTKTLKGILSTAFTIAAIAVTFLLATIGFSQSSSKGGGGSNLQISDISPSTTTIGASIKISGSGFSSTAGSNSVQFSGVKSGTVSGAVTLASPTSLTVTVPAGATTGKMYVQVGSTKSNAVQFKVVSNLPPTVNAGVNQSITLPNSANLSGNVTDDGLPTGSTVTVSWSKVNGPGNVNFSNGNSKSTTATFSVVGTYVVRLSATDGALSASSDVTVVANATATNATATNQAPVVNAGPDQTIPLPTGVTTLAGIVSDDMLPPGSTLTSNWSVISGPGNVGFSNAAVLNSSVTFAATGSYILRLTAADGTLTSTDDITIVVSAAVNQPPIANAGPNQTIILPAGVNLSGTATDDGLPNGNLTVNWSKLTGPGTVSFLSAASLLTSAVFSAAGTYELQLAATDGLLSATSKLTVVVNPISTGRNYYVDNTNSSANDANAGTDASSPWRTIGKCASTVVAGDTCNVLAGTYDDRPSIRTNGTSALRIVYTASPGVKIRGMDVSGNYTTIQGFEFTHSGMSDQTFVRSIDISGTTGVLIFNNNIHNTTGPCIRYNGATSLIIRSNSCSYAGITHDISGLEQSSMTITAGVNDQIRFSIQGGPAITKTVPAGAWTNSNVGTLVSSMTNVLSGTGAAFDCGAGVNCALKSNRIGPTSSIAIQTVSNSAYTAFGWTMGNEAMEAHAIAVQAWTNQSSGILIESNTLSHVGDYVSGSAQDHLVVRNNVLGPSDRNNAEHIDGMQAFGGNSYVLFEGNQSNNNNNVDNHLLLSQGSTDKSFIVRYNVTFRSNGGIDCTRAGDTTNPGFFIYNNTFYNNGAEYAVARLGGIQVNCGSAGNNVARNNIFFNSTRSFQSPYEYTSRIDKDYDLWFGGGSPSETHAVNADPFFVNGPSGDFRLRSGSPAIGTAGPLTTVAVGDAGSGTSLVVSNANLFQDGWAGVNPDCIAIGTPLNIACIVSIDYSTNTIALDTPINRGSGSSVWLYRKSDGVKVLYGAPDVGAIPFVP